MLKECVQYNTLPRSPLVPVRPWLGPNVAKVESCGNSEPPEMVVVGTEHKYMKAGWTVGNDLGTWGI